MSKEKLIADEICSLSLVPGFNIKNGEATEQKSLLVKQTIGMIWHWSPIEGLKPEDAIIKTHAFIIQEIAKMTIYSETSVSPSLRRKKGIVVGVARAVSTKLYGIVNGDLIVDEMDTAKLAVGEDGDTIVIKNDVDPKLKEELSKPLNLSETENKVIQRLYLISHGLIPLQGYSLMPTTDNKDQLKRVFTNVERQFWTGCDQIFWWKEDEEALRDALWHKAGHPVKNSFKKEIACSSSVKQLLIEAGIGSAAVMLPAIEAAVRKAQSYKTLLENLSPIFEDEVKWEALDVMLSYAENFSVARSKEVVVIEDAPTYLKNIDTREKVVALIEQWCTRNAGKVAICFGFYEARANKTCPNTLSMSYSLRQLKYTNFACYNLGKELFSDYTVFKDKLRQVMDVVVPLDHL